MCFCHLKVIIESLLEDHRLIQESVLQEDLYLYFYTLCIMYTPQMFGRFEVARLLDEAKSIVIYQKDVPPGSDPPLIDSQACKRA